MLDSLTLDLNSVFSRETVTGEGSPKDPKASGGEENQDSPDTASENNEDTLISVLATKTDNSDQTASAKVLNDGGSQTAMDAKTMPPAVVDETATATNNHNTQTQRRQGGETKKSEQRHRRRRKELFTYTTNKQNNVTTQKRRRSALQLSQL